MIYFDIDDTLTDSDYAHKQAIVLLFEKSVKKIENVKAAQESWLAINSYYFALYDSKELSLEEQRQLRLIEFWKQQGYLINKSEANELYKLYNNYFLENCLLFEEVAEALDAISHLPLGIISNGTDHDQIFKLDNNNIKKYFSEIIISETVGTSKPHQGIFNYALAINNRKANECFYIGNSYSIDYIGAKDAGLKSMWINRLNETRLADKENTFENLKTAVNYILDKNQILDL